MKCPACWSDKAYLRKADGFKAAVLKSCGLLPLKCQHCYHKCWTPWFMAWGKTLHPPVLKTPALDTPVHRSKPHATPKRRAA
jgi:hypothetical protein